MSDQANQSPSTKRTYVLDTSVLLSDPRAMERFAEHHVVLPIVVITELEAKRHHPELGYFARNALRRLDALRVTHGGLDAPLPVNCAGGTLHVELNHINQDILPAGFRLHDNDSRILAVAANLAAEHHHVTVVSKDLPMRIKASAVGLDAEEYRAEQTSDTEWTGTATLDVTHELVNELWEHESIPWDHLEPHMGETPLTPVCHQGLILHSSTAPPSPELPPTNTLPSSKETENSSGCVDAQPNNASPSTSSLTPPSASSPSVDEPELESLRSHCVQVWKQSSNGNNTAKSSCLGPCMQLVGKNWGTSPVQKPKK